LAGARAAVRLHLAAHPKVADFHDQTVADENVAGLDVAVEDGVGAAVEVEDAAGDAAHHR
jgi:hypothetical protein